MLVNSGAQAVAGSAHVTTLRREVVVCTALPSVRIGNLQLHAAISASGRNRPLI